MRRRRLSEDLRPTWEERHAALESVRERLRRQGADERRRRLVRRLAPGFALAACAIGSCAAAPLLRAAAAARPELFAVRRIAVVGAAQIDAAEVARTAGLAAADPQSGALAPEQLVEQLARHPWIAAARAARVSPDTLVVRIVERVPAAIWVRGEETILVDAQGRPFAAAGGDDLPRLRLAAPDALPCSEAPEQTCAPDARLAAGVELARAVERAGFARPEIELDGRSLEDPEGTAEDPEGTAARAVPVLRLAGVAPRVLLGGGDLEVQLEQLTRVLADVPASREAAEIDLRFAGQVVLRPPPPETVEGHESPSGGGPAAAGTGGRAG